MWKDGDDSYLCTINIILKIVAIQNIKGQFSDTLQLVKYRKAVLGKGDDEMILVNLNSCTMIKM